MVNAFLKKIFFTPHGLYHFSVDITKLESVEKQLQNHQSLYCETVSNPLLETMYCRLSKLAKKHNPLVEYSHFTFIGFSLFN
jgi:cystathionine beta-lyase/cystathionine gamma-synthase